MDSGCRAAGQVPKAATRERGVSIHARPDTAGRLEWDHRDPFDRILAAQGMLESLTLVTNDPPILDFTGVRTLW